MAYKDESENFNVEQGFWKKLCLKASHALSFQNRNFNGFSSIAGERLCAELVANPRAARNVMINLTEFDLMIVLRLNRVWKFGSNCTRENLME